MRVENRLSDLAQRGPASPICRAYFEKGNRFREVRCFFVCSPLTGEGGDAVKKARATAQMQGWAAPTARVLPERWQPAPEGRKRAAAMLSPSRTNRSSGQVE